jgi:chorismate mutase
MKNKKFIILFLVLLLLLLPFEETYGQSLWEETKATIASILSNLFSLDILAGCGTSLVLCVIVLIAYLLIIVFHLLLYFINNYVLANLVNFASVLDPFAGTHGQSPALIAWQVLQGFGFIILVFSALGAAYEWLLGDDATAKRMIFNIILVALLISFTFTLIQGAFYGVRNFENGITGGQSRYIGTIMSVSLWQRNPFGIVGDLTANISVSGSRLGAALLGLMSGGGVGAVVGFLAPSAALTGIAKLLVQTISYIFIILFDMGMFIILVVALTLFIVRYLYIIALTAVSPIAVATSVLPEFQKAPFLKTIFSKLHLAGDWLELLVKWLLVVPIFVIFVLLCNITKENILANINLVNLNDFVQYVMLFLGFGTCYALSIHAAVSLGGGAAAWARGIATTALFTVGGAAAGAFMYYTKGKAGQFMARMGKAIEEKVGTGGLLGLRSLISQRFGRTIREKGEEWIKARYGVDAEAAKLQVESINEQLKRATDPAQIANLAGQLTKLVQQFRGNDYVLKSINESLKGMSSESAAKILSQQGFLQIIGEPETTQETRAAIAELIRKVSAEDAGRLASNQSFLQATASQQAPEEIRKATAELIRKVSAEDAGRLASNQSFLQATASQQAPEEIRKATADLIRKVSAEDAGRLASNQSFLQATASQQAPEEIRKATAELIDKLRKSNFRARMNDANWVQNLQNLSPEFIDAVAERIEKDFKEGDVIDFMTDPARIGAIQNLPQLRDRLNRASKGFLEAVINQNVNEAANALSLLSRDFWREPGSTTKIHQILQNRPQLQPHIKDIVLQTINKSEDRESLITAAARENRGGPFRTIFASLSDQEIKSVENLLKPEFRDLFDTVILEELI